MNDHPLPPLPVRGLAAPLLRPLPAIFTYVRLASDPAEVAPDARRLFTAHLRAFKAMLVALVREAKVPPAAIKPLLASGDDLAEATGAGLVEQLSGFRAGLQALHDEYGPALRAAGKDHGDRLRRLFRTETGPLRVQTVHNDETWPFAEQLRSKLVEGCWYDAKSCHENDGCGGLHVADMVLLVPGAFAIRLDLEQAAIDAQKPIVVLMGPRPAADRENMAALRVEHLYRRSGHVVLQGPFAPIRLYQAVDGCRVRHAARLPVEVHGLEDAAS